ncbi:hypothetical protein PVT71_15205 [Salipiger sp. H15]|uniref:Uncharacterized protein n=1 Tax=Alloyangia sp. H15 TaxID=3029062 RepID=A0AAU8AM43_9RHOB
MKALNELHDALQQRRAERRLRRALRSLPGGSDAEIEAEMRRIYRRLSGC